MEQEIAEQAKIIPYILMKYINPESGKIKVDLPQNVKKIVLVASGSSYHCARFAVDLIEKFSKIESRAIYSSEFLLKSVIPHDENTLYIFITKFKWMERSYLAIFNYNIFLDILIIQDYEILMKNYTRRVNTQKYTH